MTLLCLKTGIFSTSWPKAFCPKLKTTKQEVNEMSDQQEHPCKCGGKGNCPDCPHKKK